jgi:hypothetical protein
MQRKTYSLSGRGRQKTQVKRIGLSAAHLFLSVLLAAAVAAPLASQRNFTLTGQIGYGYFGSSPFSKGAENWRYNQKFVSLNLNGFLWDPRFITFSLGANYADTSYSQELAGSDMDNIGYQVQADFFPRRKINFGFGYGKSKFSFDQLIPASGTSGALNTHTTSKDFHLNILRIKFLPDIRLTYMDRQYTSEIRQADTESERRLDLGAVKTIGISHLDLSYRYLNRENQFLAFDTFHQNLRITERFDFSPDSRLYLSGTYFDYAVRLPDETSKGNQAGGLSLHFNKKFSSRLLGSLRYSYNFRAGDDKYRSRSHQVGLRVTYNLSQHFILTPEVNYFTDRISLDDRRDNVSEPALGLRLGFQKEIAKIRLTSSVGAFYRKQQSDLKGDIDDFSQTFSLSLNSGRADKILGSLSYNFQRVDLDTSAPTPPGNLETPFYDGIGRKQDSHQARLELRSNALRFVNIYLYSNYHRFKAEYPIQGITDTQTFNNGITLSLKRLSFSADYGISRFDFGEESADYDSFSFVLDFRLIKGLDFRAQSSKRTRTDILFLGDYELVQEAYLRYNIGKFFLSAVYRKRRVRMQDYEREDEGVSLRISRSFGFVF